MAVMNIKLVWTNPTSCWHIILINESQWNGGKSFFLFLWTFLYDWPYFTLKYKRTEILAI
jgi:hypothetical protein